MPEDTCTVTCRACGTAIDDGWAWGALIEKPPCEGCGATSGFQVNVSFHSTVGMSTSMRAKGREGGRGEPVIDVRAGADLYRNTGQWNDLSRSIDKRTDQYDEIITHGGGSWNGLTPQPEEDEPDWIMVCQEPLSEHRDRGTARPD